MSLSGHDSSSVYRSKGASIPAWFVGLVATVLLAVAVAWLLSQADWDATLFVGFGEEAEPTRRNAEERLGPVHLRGGQGHDGKFFFVQAHDPWIREPETHAAVLDRPLYRSQRMMYPVLAGAAGLLSSEAIVWGLLVVNIFGAGAGTWATAAVARSMRMSTWWGLAFAFNLGLLSELVIDGGGVVSAAAAFGAVSLLLRNRVRGAIGLLVVACLSREAMLIAAAGSAYWLWRYQGRKRPALGTVGLPIAAVALWAVYVRVQIRFDSGLGEVREIGLPLVGMLRALPSWFADPVNLVVGTAILLFLVMFTRRVLTSTHLVGWAFVGFVALGVVLTQQVWENYFDMTRAIAPVFTAFVLLLFARESRTESQMAEPGP